MFKQAVNQVRNCYRVMLVGGVTGVALLAAATQVAVAQIVIRPLDPCVPISNCVVPEIDALAGASALALLVGAIALIRERRKRRRDKQSD